MAVVCEWNLWKYICHSSRNQVRESAKIVPLVPPLMFSLLCYVCYPISVQTIRKPESVRFANVSSRTVYHPDCRPSDSQSTVMSKGMKRDMTKRAQYVDGDRPSERGWKPSKTERKNGESRFQPSRCYETVKRRTVRYTHVALRHRQTNRNDISTCSVTFWISLD